MKVAIIGPGALGCLLAAKFSLAGEDVWLVDYRPARAQLLNRRGLVLHTPGGIAVPVQVKAGGAGEVGAADLTILTVKAHQTGATVRDLPVLLGAGGLALTLQNGLGNLEEMARVAGPARLVGGASILGATKLGEGEVLLAGLGPTYVGSASEFHGLCRRGGSGGGPFPEGGLALRGAGGHRGRALGKTPGKCGD